ncbi:MAG: YdcF family protein [Alphaproteobacteria bacterium]|nr:YdcF family protein [Alphaproteobacteria bacterium]
MLYDIAIVLGHEIDAHAVPDAQTRARLDKVAQLYANGLVTRIMVMGWAYRDDTSISLAQGMKNHLMTSHHLPDSSIIANEKSRDTVGDAFFSRQIYDKMQCQNQTLVVITSDYHVARAEIIFKFIYGDGYRIDVIGTIADAEGAQQADRRLQEAEQASLAAFYKTFKLAQKGDLQSISDAIYELHPLYRR